MCVYESDCVCLCECVCDCVYSMYVCMCVLAALSIFPQVCAFSIRPLNSRLACLVHSLPLSFSLPLSLSFYRVQSAVEHFIVRLTSFSAVAGVAARGGEGYA